MNLGMSDLLDVTRKNRRDRSRNQNMRIVASECHQNIGMEWSENAGKFHLAPASGDDAESSAASETPQEAREARAPPHRGTVRSCRKPASGCRPDESRREKPRNSRGKLLDTLEVWWAARTFGRSLMRGSFP